MQYFIDPDQIELIVTREDAVEAQGYIDDRRKITEKHVEAFETAYHDKCAEHDTGGFTFSQAIEAGLAAAMKSILNC